MAPTPDRASRLRRRPILLVAALALGAILALGAAWLLAGGAPDSANRTASPGQPDFGPNVYVFRPSMPPSHIQAMVNSIASRPAGNRFGQGPALPPGWLLHQRGRPRGLPGRRRHQRRCRFLQPVLAANGARYQQLHRAG